MAVTGGPKKTSYDDGSTPAGQQSATGWSSTPGGPLVLGDASDYPQSGIPKNTGPFDVLRLKLRQAASPDIPTSYIDDFINGMNAQASSLAPPEGGWGAVNDPAYLKLYMGQLEGHWDREDNTARTSWAGKDTPATTHGGGSGGGNVTNDANGDGINDVYDTANTYKKVQDQVDALIARRDAFQVPIIDPKTGQIDVNALAQATAGKAVAGTAVASAGQASSAQAALAQAALAQAQQTQAAQHLATVLAGKTNIDRTNSNLDRTGQLDLVNRLVAASKGEGPSLAENILKSGTNDALRKALAFAATSGGPAQLSQQVVADQQSKLAADAINEGAKQRVIDTLAARDQLGTAQNTLRSQDDVLAGHQADLNQGVELQNSSESNRNNQYGEGQANIVGISNTSEANKIADSNAGRLTETSNANAGRLTDVSKTNATLATDTSNQNAQRATSVSTTNANNDTNVSTTNANNDTSTSVVNANSKNNALTKNADSSLDVAKTNTANTFKGEDLYGNETQTAINSMYGITNTVNKDLQGGQAEADWRDSFAAQNKLSRAKLDFAVQQWTAEQDRLAAQDAAYKKKSLWDSILGGAKFVIQAGKLIAG